MSATVIPFPSPSVHLWLHGIAGGWIFVTTDAATPAQPPSAAEWVPVTAAAKARAHALAEQHRAPVSVHAEEF